MHQEALHMTDSSGLNFFLSMIWRSLGVSREIHHWPYLAVAEVMFCPNCARFSPGIPKDAGPCQGSGADPPNGHIQS